ncbi:RNA exonuclease 1 homolog [Mercenaria mercenaria]|uniref:RNA exonuclease 1 homolog n=1 Tax=Mercenaria mercenaria TaxID=6596 RepID=UPI00234F4A63|nr:RNA exonuclease 1 homolog [Mercenaria mercenaria]
MFASTGLFRDIPCSYFLFGLCERPYCHFKHSRQDEAKARIEAEKSALQNKEADGEYKPPTSSLQRTLQDIENSIKSEKRKLGGHDVSDNGEAQKSNQSTLKNKPTGTPEYNPTPIRELKKKRIEGKLGRSKYDLALLDDPATDGEYDPASNFSTGSKSSAEATNSNSFEETEADLGSIPDYAKHLHGTKRPAEEDTEEDESPLAKIPKFVSVEYTPAVNDSVEFSDEEPLGEKEDWFSDEASNKGSESGNVSEAESTDMTNKTNQSSSSVNEEKKTEDSKNLLPIEFTADGFVKSAYIEKHGEKKDKTKANNKNKSVRKEHDKRKEDTLFKKTASGKETSKVSSVDEDAEDINSSEKHRPDVNIFSLFKEEFDSALENCATPSKQDDSGSTPKVKLKSNDSKNRSKSPVPKLSKVSDNTHGSKSSWKEKHDSLKVKKTEEDDTSKHKTKSSSEHRHSSKTSDSKQNSASHSKRDREKANGAITDKHKHESSRKEDLSISKHKSSSSSSSSKHRESSSSRDKHLESDSHHSSVKHGSSTSKSSHDSSKLNSHHSKDHKKSERHSSKSGEKHSHSSSKHKHHSEKHGKSSGSKSGSEKSNKKKKHIVNLDVDLFGVGSEDSPYRHVVDDDDLSDLDKYFMEDDPFDECLKIFNEGAANKPSTSGEGDRKKLKKSSDHDDIPTAVAGKKRIALKQSDPSERKKTVSNKPAPKPSPAQVMMNRYKMMQDRILQAEQESKEKMKVKVRQISQQNAVKASTSTGPSKPNLASASATFSTYIANKNKKTTAVTVAKGSKRKAHTPTVPIAKLKRPTVEVSTSSKVGTNVRQRYLNQFIDEILKINPNEEEAFKRGKEEEEAVYKRCSNKQIYLNCAVNTIKRLRSELEQKKSGSKPVSTPKKTSHATILDGAGAHKTTYTLHRSGGAAKLREEDFTGAELYKKLLSYVLTEDQLRENNFPRPDPDKGGTAIFYGEVKKSQKGSTKGYEKLCVRCGKVFEVYPNGKYAVKQECVYHWGKAWKKKIAGSIETRYTCCQGDLAAEGCQVAKLHVHETNKMENMSGYMKTIPCSPPIDGDYGVYALDCEMVYTTMGVELARVTVVGADQEPVYESFVLPDNPVVDFNTRFSGITDDDMEDVHTSLRDVQAVLLSLFTDKTILMGHSLESDLIALKLIHNTVVDTSIVFPHRLGYPFKRALKNLMAEYLKKIIQDDVAGHDSLEDAVACVQLMQYRLKEDSRTDGRRLSS